MWKGKCIFPETKLVYNQQVLFPAYLPKEESKFIVFSLFFAQGSFFLLWQTVFATWLACNALFGGTFFWQLPGGFGAKTRQEFDK